MLAVFVFGAALAPGQSPAPLPPDPAADKPAADTPATPQGGNKKILDMDIDQLSKVNVTEKPNAVGPMSMNTEVTSVNKQESTVGHSPAAVFVITQDMIRRSGYNTIPDLLRLVPGLEVARIDAHTWAITSRGFNGRFANKLLVLIDGRTVYTPMFSGVQWDVQDLLLEDVDRIEVIRGPGSTLWGANAVNGVVNIITKKAKDTQGALVTYGGGSEDLALGGVRYGGHNDEGVSWRVYGKQFERTGGVATDPLGAFDSWRMGRGGFRMDWEPDPHQGNNLTIQGDFYGGNEGFSALEPIPVRPFSTVPVDDEGVTGENVLARWTHIIDDESDWSLQSYFDRAYRTEPGWMENIYTFDTEFQHRFPLGQRHHVIWGMDYRQVHGAAVGTPYFLDFLPRESTTNLLSGFVQDEITLVEDRLAFVVGTKLEHNDFTGFEYQPTGRLLYTPDKQHTVWGAISRAVRTPALFDDDGSMTRPRAPLYPDNPFSPYYFARLLGSGSFQSEDLMAYEVGYRAQPHERFAWDIALFYNVYENLESWQRGQFYIDAFGNIIVPYTRGNGTRGETYGLELTGQLTVRQGWRLSAWYSFCQMQLHTLPGVSYGVEYLEGDSPRNQARLISSWDLPRCWQFDLTLRYVDELEMVKLPTYTITQIPNYITMDARLAWVPNRNFEIAVVGQNLLSEQHAEYGVGQFSYRVTDVQRSVFAKATWRY